ncbi:MAG: hypothetical protein ACLTKE_01755 [Coprococcus sp.]
MNSVEFNSCKRNAEIKASKSISTPYTCMRAIKEGGIETKLSMILMGFGNFVHKQKIKGLLYLTLEVAYIVFMAVNGIHFLNARSVHLVQCAKKYGMRQNRCICAIQRGSVGYCYCCMEWRRF